MKVVSNCKVFDFDKVATLSYRASVFGSGFLVEIKNLGNGYFTDAIEITRVSSLETARLLVQSLTENWAANTPIFYVDKWLAELSVGEKAQTLNSQLSSLKSAAHRLEGAVTNLLDDIDKSS